ncbi:MAG: cytochrome C [Planctomycetes bacterium]|jgi:mono/diheme cytochrome c family protein|nr:cytochrome C [Planctomycetota bacterium]MDP6410203.1 cytochrome c [Planctomycetota bacterium]
MNPSRRTLLVFFLPAIALLLILESLLLPNPRERNFELLTEMVYSKAAESLGASDGLPAGMTQQAIVEGVVVRGRMPFHFAAGQEEAARAGKELSNPYADDGDVLERGGELFGRFCAVCHGHDGGGRGPVVERGMLPPPSLSGARALAIADGEMFHIVTMGQGNMGSHAAQIVPDDRWKVIRYIRSLQEPAR